MKTLTADDIIGRRIEGVYEVPVDGGSGYQGNLVLVQIAGLGVVPLELADVKNLPILQLYDGKLGKPASNSEVTLLLGAMISDVVASEYLASIGLVLDDGRIIVNEVLEFGSYASVVSPGFFDSGAEYVSLRDLGDRATESGRWDGDD